MSRIDTEAVIDWAEFSLKAIVSVRLWHAITDKPVQCCGRIWALSLPSGKLGPLSEAVE